MTTAISLTNCIITEVAKPNPGPGSQKEADTHSVQFGIMWKQVLERESFVIYNHLRRAACKSVECVKCKHTFISALLTPCFTLLISPLVTSTLLNPHIQFRFLGPAVMEFPLSKSILSLKFIFIFAFQPCQHEHTTWPNPTPPPKKKINK